MQGQILKLCLIQLSTVQHVLHPKGWTCLRQGSGGAHTKVCVHGTEHLWLVVCTLPGLLWLRSHTASDGKSVPVWNSQLAILQQSCPACKWCLWCLVRWQRVCIVLREALEVPVPADQNWHKILLASEKFNSMFSCKENAVCENLMLIIWLL